MATTFTDLIRDDLKDYCPASNLAFNEKVRQLISQGEQIYHFGFGQAPFPVVECMTRALKENAAQNAYLSVAGIPALREAICAFHQRHDVGMEHLTDDHVIVGPGTKELIFLLACVFKGDVMVISPSWTTYKPQVQLAHHKPIVVNASQDNEWRIAPQDLIKAVSDNNLKGNKLLILCNPDNPTGTNYRSEDLKQLAEVCRSLNIIVLCDEIYSRLHYEDNHASLAKFYPEGTIISSGMSKWASAGGWRLGYHMYPSQLSALYTAVKSAASHTYSCAPAPVQYAVAQGLQETEEVDAYIKHTTRIMRLVGEFCHKELTSIGVKVTKPTAGYYIFPNFELIRGSLMKRGIVESGQMCDAVFKEAKVALMGGGPAFLRPTTEFTTRLCYVNFDGAEALKRSRQIGLQEPLTEDFVKECCTPVYSGILALKQWVLDQLKGS
ncbi:hypothetical protein CAPTEDRAFT_214481 [Capitella teleta]|uniref:Aminotransferase class I/classII large domain-containing protein n=1 Tax=Capitella teleta TaxID=283909 RepID=R7TCL5_CAPTE|nr:hypothetical protein CAPTEDRAFT_214481 [Capitella teleta]|eukprot:ELT91252.1 hypothetical protein CAPTEDRAFT_214481 [Capitella teleta]